MAKVSQITVPNGTTYDIGVKYPNVSPILSKTFTGVIATEANWTNGVFFFGSVKPASWNGLWSIKYKVYAEAAGQPLSQARATVTIAGNQDVYRTYASYNEFANADYRPCYYHELYRMKRAGFDGGYGHALGLRIYSAWNATNAANARTITIEIYECHNCTFEFYDSMLKYAEIPGTGSTNYNTYSELDFASQGLCETGDSNDVNYYNREYYPSRKVYAALYRYQFLLTKDYEYLLPTNSVNNSTATTKAMTTEEFDPFGEIYYWNTTTTASAGASMPNSSLYRQYMADLRYAFNYAQGTFTARKPVYLVCTPQENGMAKLYSEPLTQTLPTTADGRMYIYLGTMFEDTSPYRVNLSLHHEVFMYIDGEARAVGPHALTAGDAATVNGHTVAKDVPSDAKFTDTTYTPASASPKMDGTAAVGTSVKYAREDHVHPTDTSRVPTSRKVNGHALSADVTITASDVSAIPTSQKGSASGVAELDSSGKVPSSQLPSYVDDVLEYSAKSSFPATGETGKIYVDTSNNKTYRWSGSAYVEISQSLALGETSSTAYRGDYGKAAYTHAVTNKGSAFSSGLYKITTNAEGHVTAATAVAKADITALGIPAQDTTYTAATTAPGNVASSSSVGTSTNYARQDHTHGISLATGDNNGQVKIAGTNVSVKGLGTAAYKASTDFVGTTDELFTTNPFAGRYGSPGLYISKIDNAFYAATKRFDVDFKINGTSHDCDNLFDGSYETVAASLGTGSTAVLTMDFSNLSGGVFPGYAYGYIIVSFYYNRAPSSVTGRVYNTYEPHTIGWSDLSFSRVDTGNTASSFVYRARQGKYGLQKLEITIAGLTNGSTTTGLCQVEMHLDRPSPERNPFLTKYYPETLYYNLTAPGFIGNLIGDASTVNGHTVEKDVPSNAVFTDNNNAVTQTATTGNANYEVLFSATADNTTRTEGARKNSNITFNPSTGNLNVTQINGVTVGSSPKFTDNNTTYSAGTGLSLSSTTFNHSNSVTAGTAGTSSATSGSTLAVPYVTYDAQGHVTASGTHTHTISGFLTSHQTIKQDGVTGATVNRYGACTTAAGTAAKAVSVTTGTFSLEAGARVSVKFNNANTANSPTLNVNSTGAKNIFHKGAQITSGSNKALLAGICDFIYDGTQWHLVGNYIDTDNNTTYGLSISGHTVSIVAGGTTSSVTVPDNNTTYTANNENIGSASAGTAIPADDITAWSAGTMFSASASEGVVTFTAGTAPSLSYTAKSIPNISVTTKSVTTSITAS